MSASPSSATLASSIRRRSGSRAIAPPSLTRGSGSARSWYEPARTMPPERGALRALREAPSPVALVGFDDFELADMLATPVTVVRHAPEEMGRIAAQLAYGRLDDGRRPPERTTITCELVIRGSGEVAP